MSGRSTRSTAPGRGNTGRAPPASPPGAATAAAPAAASPAAAPSLPDLMTTIQNLQQQVQALQQQQQPATTTGAPAPAPRFAVTPARHRTGFLDFDQKADTILYKEATKSLYQDPQDRYNLDPEHTQSFLNKVYDRGQHCNLSVLMVPEDNSSANPQLVNYCKNHAQFDLDHLRTYAQTYIGAQVRKAQDDKILCRLLQESLSESAYKVISTDRTDYTVNGTECGLLMLRHILEHSSVDTTIDPNIVRDELTRAHEKFVSLHCDVKAFNEWFSEKVEQLKQNGILDTELHWLRSILFTSYEKSTDPLFKAHIEQQKDYLRDNPDKSKDFTWKILMSRASKKVDSLLIDSKRASNNNGNPILALETKLKNQQTVIQQLVHEHQASNGKGKSNSNRKKHDKGKKGKRIPFPDELKSKPRPDDPNKAVTIAGNDYYWCDEHKKWGRHKTSQCHKRNGKPDTTRGSRNSNQSQGSRHGRLVKALAALTE